MKYILFVALTLLISVPAASAAEVKAPARCWLAQEVQRGGFTLKFFLTDRHQEIMEEEDLAGRFPGGQVDRPVELSEFTRRNLILGGAQSMYLEIWRGDKLVYIMNDSGAFEYFSGFDKALMRQDDYPVRGCVTHALYYNTGGPIALSGRNIMLSLCPNGERLTAYQTRCHWDILYERVSGGRPDDEFDRLKKRPDSPALRLLCDPGLDNYGRLGAGGLPRPVRLLVFDDQAGNWRADRAGEFPKFYYNQIPISLEYSGLELKTAPPASADRAAAEKAARELMAEIKGAKTTFIKKTGADLAFVSYSLLMMGLPAEEVKSFFLEMAAEYAKVRGSFNWAKAGPEKVFADIAASAEKFRPVDWDQFFPADKNPGKPKK